MTTENKTRTATDYFNDYKVLWLQEKKAEKLIAQTAVRADFNTEECQQRYSSLKELWESIVQQQQNLKDKAKARLEREQYWEFRKMIIKFITKQWVNN